MFNSNNGGGAALKAGSAVTDFKEELERSRERIKACGRVEEIFMELEELPVVIDLGEETYKAAKHALGSIFFQRYAAIQAESRWLAAIAEENES